MTAPGRDPVPAPAAKSAQFSSTRRQFLRGLGLVGAASVCPPLTTAATANPANAKPSHPDLEEYGRDPQPVILQINGQTHTVSVAPRDTLLDVLRHQLNLTGTKSICEHGACGGCSVLWDGRAVPTCLCLAREAAGHEILTVEGIADDPRFAPLIEAFCAHDAAQCGFCIPGFVVRAAELFLQGERMSTEEVQIALSGNLCRCGTHAKIVTAVTAALSAGAIA